MIVGKSSVFYRVKKPPTGTKPQLGKNHDNPRINQLALTRLGAGILRLLLNAPCRFPQTSHIYTRRFASHTGWVDWAFPAFRVSFPLRHQKMVVDVGRYRAQRYLRHKWPFRCGDKYLPRVQLSDEPHVAVYKEVNRHVPHDSREQLLPSRPWKELRRGQRRSASSDPLSLAARTTCGFAQQPHSRGRIET